MKVIGRPPRLNEDLPCGIELGLVVTRALTVAVSKAYLGFVFFSSPLFFLFGCLGRGALLGLAPSSISQLSGPVV